MEKITQQQVQAVLTPRLTDSYKGSFGRILAVGGNENFGGAITMAAKAAVYSGAGLVTVATSKDNLPALHAVVPEAMYINYFDKVALSAAVAQATVTIVGPGLGTSSRSHEILQIVLTNFDPAHYLIVDGSALTLLAQDPKLQALLPTQHVIFTPHPGEWQRLTGLTVTEQDDVSNRQAQQRFQATVVLKKYHTTIYHATGTTSQLTVGGPAMATGGMGDTLTGIIAAFLGQFSPAPLTAVVNAAVYTHSALADQLALTRHVVVPSVLIDHLPTFIHQLQTP